LKLEIAARADREIERALTWWIEHRPDAPALLSDEIAEYLDKLKRSPNLGELWGVRRGKEIRRVLLPRTKKKIYVLRPDPDTVRIICFWGGQRGREPKL
jgi:plasmid stabilization system protein ParE